MRRTALAAPLLLLALSGCSTADQPARRDEDHVPAA